MTYVVLSELGNEALPRFAGCQVSSTLSLRCTLLGNTKQVLLTGLIRRPSIVTEVSSTGDPSSVWLAENVNGLFASTEAKPAKRTTKCIFLFRFPKPDRVLGLVDCSTDLCLST
jgi:hypothetical protein